jgi:hypothetical protein
MKTSEVRMAWTTWCLLCAACGAGGGRAVSDSAGWTSQGAASTGATAGSTATGPTTTGVTDGGGSTSDAQASDAGSDSAPTSTVATTDPDTSTSTTAPSTGGPGSSTGDRPSAPNCSDDLHDIIDEHGDTVATCPGDQACFEGACMPACAAAAAYEGTLGCDFWAPMPPSIHNANPLSPLKGPCFAVFLANAWTEPANITVTRGDQQFELAQYGRIPKTVGNEVMYEPIPPGGLPPDEVAILFLSHRPGTNTAGISLECPAPPAVLEDTAVTSTGRGQAFHVVTDVPVSAYDINPYGGGLTFFPSASLLFPATAWGTNHMAIAPHPSIGAQFALVVAREDDTIVKVAPASAFPGGGGVAPAPAGVTTQYVLNAGESLQWAKEDPAFDPSGAVFESDKPIGLWTGSTYLLVASQTLGPGGGDAAHQQIAPVKAMGDEYVGAGVITRLASLAPESVPYRMVGAVDGTELSWDPQAPPGAPAALAAGQVAEFETSAAFTVRSQGPAHPFLFSQYMPGAEANARPGCVTKHNNLVCGLGDEEWVSLLSPKQFQRRYIFFTDPTFGTTNLVIIRRRGAAGFTDVTVECLGVIGGWMPVGGEGTYEYAHVELERGGVPVGACGTSRHLAESEGQFGVVVWGTDLYSSYGYPAGSTIAKINEVVLPVPG